MNDLDLCLEVVSRSRQPLRYIWRWISRKPLEIEVERNISKTTWARDFKFGARLCMGNAEQAHK